MPFHRPCITSLAWLATIATWSAAAAQNSAQDDSTVAVLFPPELVSFVPYDGNPVFSGTGRDTWDKAIRERGYILSYYHGTAHAPWKDWSTLVAVSRDLIHWTKYPGNPVVAGDKSIGILVDDGTGYRLYTMHPDVRVYFGNEAQPVKAGSPRVPELSRSDTGRRE